VQLIFDRVVTKKTPGEFRTRVIQDDVHPSLHPAEGPDLPSTENQSLLRHPVRLEGCPADLLIYEAFPIQKAV
jgi:hypothetical protein